MVKKKLLSVTLVAVTVCSMIFTGCGSSAENTGNDTGKTDSDAQAGNTAGDVADVADDVEKPEKITIMVDGTFQATLADGQEEWVNKWEELTGIELEVIQPDHNAYYDVLGQTFASGPENWPDVVILGSSYYSGYAGEGALWDMTDAWNNSELKKNPNTDVSVVEGNMLDGHLYGLALGGGGGCMTFLRKQWLDNCGLDIPTTYEEYLEMLDAFSNGDPDGDGINGNTIGVSAAGFVGNEAPYTNYLPEFYQDAYPSFYQGEDGVWRDGFTEDSMKEAIKRLQDAYNKGYIDKESLTNATSNCRTKFMEGEFGAFTYWAGGWSDQLSDGLAANGQDSELVFMPPIAEVGKYWQRCAPVYAITSSCKNPEGVFKYFLESIFDDGDMETLWIYGVEGVHWSRQAETVCGNTYQDGEFHMMEMRSQPGVQYTTIIMGDTNICPLTERLVPVKKYTEESMEIFNANNKTAPLPVTTDMMSQYNGDLTSLKNSIIADCVVQGVSVEEGYKRFEQEGGAEWSQAIVDSLNNK